MQISRPAMSNTDKLREIAFKWGCRTIPSHDFTDDKYEDKSKELLSDLTALISENYYPKEFTNYCIKNVDYCRDMGKEWYQIMASGILILKTLDDVYNYWKENEQ